MFSLDILKFIMKKIQTYIVVENKVMNVMSLSYAFNK